MKKIGIVLTLSAAAMLSSSLYASGTVEMKSNLDVPIYFEITQHPEILPDFPIEFELTRDLPVHSKVKQDGSVSGFVNGYTKTHGWVFFAIRNLGSTIEIRPYATQGIALTWSKTSGKMVFCTPEEFAKKHKCI